MPLRGRDTFVVGIYFLPEMFRHGLALYLAQVAELYEELKNRISQFNMHVDSQRPVLDQEYVYKQRFILQVCCFCLCWVQPLGCGCRERAVKDTLLLPKTQHMAAPKEIHAVFGNGENLQIFIS